MQILVGNTENIITLTNSRQPEDYGIRVLHLHFHQLKEAKNKIDI